MSNGSPFEFYQFKQDAFDFWRCYTCGRLFTYEQERARIASLEYDLKARMCQCGSMKYKPSRPAGIEWLKPNVVTYTLKLVLARGVAPWLEKHYPRALPWVERLCKPMEA